MEAEIHPYYSEAIHAPCPGFAPLLKKQQLSSLHSYVDVPSIGMELSLQPIKPLLSFLSSATLDNSSMRRTERKQKGLEAWKGMVVGSWPMPF